MSPKRGDRVAPPPVNGEYDIKYAKSAAATGWEELSRQSPGNLRRAYEAIRENPRSKIDPTRQHRLKGDLGRATWKGQPCERWQYEVTGGGRIWYLIDDENGTVWLDYAGTGHPKATD